MAEEVEDPSMDLLNALYEKLHKNLYSLESHLELIHFLKSMGEEMAEAVSEARQTAIGLVEFPQEEYISWIEEEPREGLEAVFSSAVEAWPSSVAIWDRYLEYALEMHEQQSSSNPVDNSKLEGLFQRAVASTEWDMADSHIVWKRYREFMMTQLQDGDTTTADKLVTIKQFYLQRLSVPHNELQDTFSSFSSFMSEYDEANYEAELVKANSIYSQTAKLVTYREDYELLIKKDPSINSYAAYIDWELSQPKRFYKAELAAALYERALLMHFNVPEIWDDYIVLLFHSPTTNTNTNAIKRATRACPWSGLLWSHYLHMERARNPDKSFQESSKLMETVISLPFFEPMTPENFEHRKNIELALMSIAVQQEPQRAQQDLDYVVKSASSSLIYSAEFDPSMSLELTMIQLYAERLQNIPAARKIWTDSWKHRASQSKFWIAWIRWEAYVAKDIDLAHKAIDKALRQSPLDYPAEILDEAVLLERTYGSAFSIESSYARARSSIKIINRQKWKAEQAAAQTEAYTEAHTEAQAEEPASDNVSAKGLEPQALKRFYAEDNETQKESPMPGKRVKIATGTSTSASGENRNREHNSVIVSNISAPTTADEIKKFFSDCGTIASVSISEQSEDNICAIVEFASHGDSLAALTKTGKMLNGKQVAVTSGEGTTVWVTNFSPALGESDLRAIFEKCGHVLNVRLPSLKFNTNRRFAYVQFMSPEEANKAVDELGGKETNDEAGKVFNMVVKISNPEEKKPRVGRLHEERELIVKGLDFKMTEPEIKEIFSKHGEIESFNIPPSKHDSSRAHDGYAFVTYKEKEQAQEAVSSEDGKKVHGRRIAVSFASAGKERSENLSGSKKLSKSDARTLHIHNLADTVSKGQLNSLLSKYGKVDHVQLFPKEERAVVQFDTAADAGKASLYLEGNEIAGRKISISDGRIPKKKLPVSTKPVVAFAPRSTRAK